MFQKSARFKVTRTEEKGREPCKNKLKRLSGRNSQSCHNSSEDQFVTGKVKLVVQKTVTKKYWTHETDERSFEEAYISQKTPNINWQRK